MNVVFLNYTSTIPESDPVKPNQEICGVEVVKIQSIFWSQKVGTTVD